jgi:hypothetical protein
MAKAQSSKIRVVGFDSGVDSTVFAATDHVGDHGLRGSRRHGS